MMTAPVPPIKIASMRLCAEETVRLFISFIPVTLIYNYLQRGPSNQATKDFRTPEVTGFTLC